MKTGPLTTPRARVRRSHKTSAQRTGLPGARQESVAWTSRAHAAGGCSAQGRTGSGRPQSRKREGGGLRRPEEKRREKERPGQVENHAARQESPRPPLPPHWPGKRPSRDTDLPVLQLLQMHAGYCGRRQHHREAQHQLRPPRHPRAGRRGRPLPRPRGPRAPPCVRRCQCEPDPIPRTLSLSHCERRPPPPGANNREPSGSPAPWPVQLRVGPGEKRDVLSPLRAAGLKHSPFKF